MKRKTIILLYYNFQKLICISLIYPRIVKLYINEQSSVKGNLRLYGKYRIRFCNTEFLKLDEWYIVCIFVILCMEGLNKNLDNLIIPFFTHPTQDSNVNTIIITCISEIFFAIYGCYTIWLLFILHGNINNGSIFPGTIWILLLLFNFRELLL